MFRGLWFTLYCTLTKTTKTSSWAFFQKKKYLSLLNHVNKTLSYIPKETHQKFSRGKGTTLKNWFGKGE